MAPVAARGLGEIGLTGQMMQAGHRIDHPAIEEHPARRPVRRVVIGLREGQYPVKEGDRVGSGQRGATLAQLLRDDSPPRLRDDGVAAPGKFIEQGRLAAAGAAGQDDEALYAAIRHASCSPA